VSGKKHKDSDLAAKKKQVPDHMNPLKVFVGGLPWAIAEETVRRDFEECGPIERFDMPLNSEGRPSGNAYVYYKTEAGVEKALEYDGTEYSGRTLKVKRAERQNKEGQDSRGADSKGDKSKVIAISKARDDETTVFVGGLSYDTEQETLTKDFGECGEIKTIRMLKNDEGAFKGIAFIVFKDESGVKEALKYDGDQYGGRTLRVSRASSNGKGKDGKGKDGKGKDSKGKGKGKDGKGKKGKGICYKFKEGSCPFGDRCIFAHE